FKQQNLNNEVVGANWDVGYKTSHPTVMAFHRYGFRRWLTLGLRGEADPDLQNLGPMLNVLMSRKGELSAGMAISRSAAKSAKAAYARYYYTSKFFHLRSDISYFDENYAHHNLPPGVVRTKQSQNVGAGLHGLKLGSISFNYNETQYHRETASQRLSVVLSTRIGRLTSLLLRATQMQTAGVFSNSMLLSLHTSLGRRAAANASYTQDEDHFNQNFYIHETAPAGRGIGYRLRLGETEQTKNNGDWVGDASLRVKNKFALISSDVTKAVGYKSYQTSISGSLAFVDNEFFLTQPIRDSFALVKAGQLDDIQVFYNNEPMGRTQKGRLIIPNLTSYAKNSLSIDASALPVNMSLHNDRQTISPSFRSGGVAEFELEKFQGFVGHIYFRQGMQRKPADYAEYRIKTAQGSIDSIVGLRGEIYLENLHPGSYAGKLFYKGEQCDFEINVPQSEELQVELEDVYCEI
ncbi:MAG: fimbria/pilus outer membrane usher protein, partial [Gammaproteobacteria bacterium]|nr:fimbria/pilus outer membrane usher protein [Gammaproteobacteria bacterium]